MASNVCWANLGVRYPQIYSKVQYGCKRPAVLSEKFCVGVRDPWCNPKSDGE